ncbi:MAG: FkbM family methyltransferase [Isosphaeraceae bacterium]|nr:FkbM family methyltransferase [Isosphaeraceae bacterium]
MMVERDDPVERPQALTRISYAQNMEDILLDRLFQGRPGTFVDIGANHPFIDSNTYFFYLRGWRGVNIEPDPRSHAQLQEHRPEDLNLAVAVSEVDSSELTFYEVDDHGTPTGLSTLSAEVAEGHRAHGFTVTEHRVPVRGLASLIAEYQIEPPDLVSIDVEGHETPIIRGIPLATWRPKVFVIEATVPLSGIASHLEWEPILLAQGYIFATFNGVNRFYLRDDLADKKDLFATPVNVLDNYFRHDLMVLQARYDVMRDRYEQEKAAREFERNQFAEIRAGWEWGMTQALEARNAWDWERRELYKEREKWKEAAEFFAKSEAYFNEERANWQRERESLLWFKNDHENQVLGHQRAEQLWEQERQRFEQERQRFEQERATFEQERVVMQEERTRFEQERNAFQEDCARFEQERARFEQERAAWQVEREHFLHQLAETQRLLRPYRLIDRLGVVTTGYGWARRWKKRRAS